jgi:hypothetical protein
VAEPNRIPPDHTPQPANPQSGQKPAIITYIKPAMELYVAREKFGPAPIPRGMRSDRRCTCNAVCTCEQVATCGCDQVQARQPPTLTVACTCDTVAACTCNSVQACTCNRVVTMECRCDTVCACVGVCTCQNQCPCLRHMRCPCLPVALCNSDSHCACDQHVHSGGGSVCVCVPVIH